jgi:hypothetical protein
VGLAGIEAAKVAAAAASAAKTTTAEAATTEAPIAEASAKSSAGEEGTATTAENAHGLARRPARTAARALAAVLGAQRLGKIPQPVHVDAGKRTYRAGLPGDGNGVAAEIGVTGH